MTLNALIGVERVVYSMRDEQVARLGQFDRAAHLSRGGRRKVWLRHTSRRARCFRRIGSGFSGTASIDVMGAINR